MCKYNVSRRVLSRRLITVHREKRKRTGGEVKKEKKGERNMMNREREEWRARWVRAEGVIGLNANTDSADARIEFLPGISFSEIRLGS